MTHEVDKWDAEEWLQHNKDIWNHPMVTDRTESNAYEVADLMADFTNYILDKQKQKTKDMKQTAVEWLERNIKLHGFTTEQVIETIKLFEKAKEIERQQIMDAVNATMIDDDLNAYEYFTETYE